MPHREGLSGPLVDLLEELLANARTYGGLSDHWGYLADSVQPVSASLPRRDCQLPEWDVTTDGGAKLPLSAGCTSMQWAGPSFLSSQPARPPLGLSVL